MTELEYKNFEGRYLALLQKYKRLLFKTAKKYSYLYDSEEDCLQDIKMGVWYTLCTMRPDSPDVHAVRWGKLKYISLAKSNYNSCSSPQRNSTLPLSHRDASPEDPYSLIEAELLYDQLEAKLKGKQLEVYQLIRAGYTVVEISKLKKCSYKAVWDLIQFLKYQACLLQGSDATNQDPVDRIKMRRGRRWDKYYREAEKKCTKIT